MSAELYSRWLHELWGGDLEDLETTAASVVSPDFVGHWPHRMGFVRGPAQLADVIRQGRAMFDDDLVFELVVGPIVQGELVAARWVARDHHAQRPVRFHGHDILRRGRDEFVEYWSISETPPGVSR